MSIEMVLFLKCMLFIGKCMLCFYGICGLSYFVPLERILGIKKPQKEECKILSVAKNNSVI